MTIKQTTERIDNRDVIVREYVPGCPIRYERHPSGLYFNAETPERVRSVLHSLMGSDQRIRLFYGDREHPDWMEEHDVTGYVRRTTGPMQVAILLPRADSIGGCAILTQHVQRVMCTSTRRELYRSPHYRAPILAVIRSEDQAAWDVVDPEGGTLARFDSRTRAEHWCQYMRGERMAK